MRATNLILAGAVIALSACAPVDAGPSPSPPAGGNCAVIDGRSFSAHINAMPGPGAQRTLIVTGEVDLPTPGYTVSLDLGAADRSAIPVQQLILSTTAPTGIVTQVVTQYPVRYEGPAIAQQYRAVRVMCGGRELAELLVTVAH